MLKPEQIIKINELFGEGYSLKTIAKIVGCSDVTVKNHTTPPKEATCVCGKTFAPRRRHQKYCSHKCGRVFWQKVYKEGEIKPKKPRKQKVEPLEVAEARARDMGMSYGKMEAMKFMQMR